MMSTKIATTDYTAASQALGSKRYYVSKAYQAILPEASDLEWSDDFFEDDEGIVAVFDFDYIQIVDFNTKTALAGWVPSLGCISIYGALFGGQYAAIAAVAAPMAFLLVTLTPCFLRSQVEWEAYAQHVAVTRDGIRFVQDKRKSCWGISICDKGRHSKTVPYDKITDCDIIEPAGAAYLCIPRVLMTVNVDTASSGGEGKQFELKITGLQDSHRFKQLVWAMKRSDRNSSLQGARYEAPQSLEMTERSKAPTGTSVTNAAASALQSVESGDSNSSVKHLLRDIREELRQNNQLMKEMKESKKQGDAPYEKGEMV